MINPNSSRYLIILVLSFFTFLVNAQPRDSYNFTVEKGSVVVTPSFCVEKTCESTSAELSGSFVAFLPGGGSQILFTSSSVSTTPNLAFVLPFDPNETSGGTVREASFEFDSGYLYVRGIIDSRAFDGPLIEYNFAAKVGDSKSGEIAFFTARPDYRKCISPLCGGYFVKKVNNDLTLCADGTKQKECYVAEIDPSKILFSKFSGKNETPIFLQGKIATKNYSNFGDLGIFKAKYVAQSATDITAKGDFFGVEYNGIMCITTPCFNYDQTLLNKNLGSVLSRVNFEESGASKDKIELANKILANGGVLYASGQNRKYNGFSGIGLELIVNQFYLPAKIGIICQEGYEDVDGSCQTPYGCVYPKIQLTSVGGAAIIDPVTGEITSTITESCVDTCEFPAELESPGRCVIYLP